VSAPAVPAEEAHRVLDLALRAGEVLRRRDA
jgi:hypothetical protein